MSVLGATVEDQLNSFVIRVRLDLAVELAAGAGHGPLTVAGIMRLYVSFGEDRWLAAPVISTKNGTGNIVFTPDCTREEASGLCAG